MEKLVNTQYIQKMKLSRRSLILFIGDWQRLEIGHLQMMTSYLNAMIERITQIRTERLKPLLNLPVVWVGIVAFLK